MTPRQTPEAKLIDVSHIVEDGLITYPGLPAVFICDFLTREASRAHYAQGTEFHIGKIEMVANSGTYVDSPFHRYEDGLDLAEVPLNKLANLDGIVIPATNRTRRAIEAAEIQSKLPRDRTVADKAVLIHTGWSKHWRTEEYFHGHPYLTEDAALFLRDEGAVLVGIDSLNIDDTDDGRRPVHSILLRAEIPVVEHLTNLESLPRFGFRFFAVPVKVRAFGTFPVRAFGLIPAQE